MLAKSRRPLYHWAMTPHTESISPPPCQAEKRELRSALRARRKALPPSERSALSLAAQHNILDSGAWKKARSVALYMPMPEETDTAALLQDAWATGKTVLLPLCSPEEPGHMNFFACTGLHELTPGSFGILEPDIDALVHNGPECALPAAAPELVIVPGVAFDNLGRRLGMGGGYYDRLFARPDYAGTTRIGLAFDFQRVPALPGGDWDLPVHALSTEKGLVWIQQP